MTVTRKRRWLQFSLKGMLVVMTLACVGLGWLAYERNEVRKRQEAIAAIKELRGDIDFDDEQPFRPKWLSPLLGDTSAGEVVLVEFSGNDAELVHLKGLTKLEWLYLWYSPVTDSGLVHLQGLTELKGLALNDTRVTDAGLTHLQGLTKLELLLLSDTQITDAGLVHLKSLTGLVALTLDNTQVTDAGLVHLKGLTKLEVLDLAGTQVTEQGVSDLKKVLPNTKITP